MALRVPAFLLPVLFGSCAVCLAAPVKKDDAFLGMVEGRTFRYFAENTNPGNGLVIDKSPNSRPAGHKYAPASVAAVGFGLAALPAGVERGWISKSDGAKLAKTTLLFFRDKMESEHGFFYHFVDMDTGLRAWDSEISSIDTALFLAGALTAGQYFGDPEIKTLADGLYERADWAWMTNGTRLLCGGWTPEKGFLSYYWHQYDESMVMYILALGSPTHPLDPSSWRAIKRTVGEYKGHELILSPPLFTHQFSHAFVDFRGKSDGFADYFKNSVEATLANRRFCMDNAASYKTYGPDSWGLTASIGPDGYKAYGAPPGLAVHDGTVAPAAAASSIVFTPELSIAAMRNFYAKYRDRLWGRYGFSDSFNLDRDFFAPDAYAINQGSTVLMIENYRTGLVWKLFMALPQVEKGMASAGFGGAYIALNKKVLPFSKTAVYFRDRRPFVAVKRIKDSAQQSLRLDSPLWKKAQGSIELGAALLSDGINRQPGYGVRIDMLADTRFLFVKFQARDSEIISSHPDAAMYEDDSVEIYIDSKDNKFDWGGADDYQFIFSPGAGGLRAREFLHTDRTSGAFRILDSSVTARGYGAVVAFDRAALGIGDANIGFSPAAHNVDQVLDSAAKFNWFFLEPAVYLGGLKVEKGL